MADQFYRNPLEVYYISCCRWEFIFSHSKFDYANLFFKNQRFMRNKILLSVKLINVSKILITFFLKIDNPMG